MNRDLNRQIADEQDKRRHYLQESQRLLADEKQVIKYQAAANRCGERIRELLKQRKNYNGQS